MTSFHPEYNEYATCTVCGMKKYCRPDEKCFVCYACDHGNFARTKKGLIKEHD